MGDSEGAHFERKKGSPQSNWGDEKKEQLSNNGIGKARAV